MGNAIIISALAFFQSIIAPAYQDFAPADPTNVPGFLSEFTLMDNVVTKRQIITIRKTGNILQRRDAGCDLVYKKIAGADVRQIETTELYGATQQCNHEFYQDCLRDWRNNDPLFADKITPFFKQTLALDLVSNAYFGDTSRANNPLAKWSTNKFDGVFRWMVKYYKGGMITPEKGIALAATDFAEQPTLARGLIVQMYNKQDVLMRAQPATDKEFSVTQAIYDGYESYLDQTVSGSAVGASVIVDGQPRVAYKGIPLVVRSLWQPILTELYGENANAAVLTLKGNFVFGTDKEYGEDNGEVDETGKPMHDALMVWYEKKDLSWYYQMFLKAGTQIALPEYVVFAVPPAMLA